MFFRAGLVSVALPAFALCGAVQASDIHVPADQPTIQQGIDAASAGDRVLVAPGTYFEHIDFHGRNIQVLGTGGASATTIDGSHDGKVVTFMSGESRDAVLSGFSIVNGFANADWYLDAMGGGVWISNSSPTISDNEIRENQGCAGGGGIGIFGGNPRIHHNRIRLNSAGCGIFSGEGGGVYMQFGARGTIDDNLIEANVAASDGGGVKIEGSGGPVLVGRNIIRANVGDLGAGIFIGVAQSRVYDNLVIGNQGQSGMWISGENSSDHMLVVNNTIADNPAFEDLHVQALGGIVVVENNIVRASLSTRTVYCSAGEGGSALFKDNLFHASNGAGIDGNCDTGTGLVTDDPRFARGAGPHAYWLSGDSPAIDAGDNGAVQRIPRDASGAPRIIGGTVDLGAYEFRGN